VVGDTEDEGIVVERAIHSSFCCKNQHFIIYGGCFKWFCAKRWLNLAIYSKMHQGKDYRGGKRLCTGMMVVVKRAISSFSGV
jgi:hypothetical protein